MSYQQIMQDSINSLNCLSVQCQKEIESWGYINTDIILQKSASSLDVWDYCFSIAIGMLGARITTSSQLENYLINVHKAASNTSGNYTGLQKILGMLLEHKGDSIDKIAADKCFKNRANENAYGLFHRLLWGHDILSVQGDNPFRLMIEQQGVSGILQAVRHLIADTMSKQGLPLPGSSFLDYTKNNGKISNYLIKIAQDFAQESVQNKNYAQTIYSHMFTIRAQDIMGGSIISAVSAAYFKIRDIQDSLRRVQFCLIAYSVAFFGQAILGAAKQAGVPFINIPLATVIFKNLIQLYYFSIKETRQLHDRTQELIKRGNVLTEKVKATDEEVTEYNNANDYLDELSKGQRNVDSLIEFFERRQI